MPSLKAMAKVPSQMRLSAEHVARVHRELPDPGPQPLEGFRPATTQDYDAMVGQMLATAPEGPFWLFGYGSLIWKPETEYAERRVALVRGWHRRFCLGWDHRFRGNPEQPGLMLALDRGGQCKGVAFRLPGDGLEENLHKLIRREMSMVPSAFPPRWVNAMTPAGPVRALTFAMNRRSGRYVADLSDQALAEILATACGFRGSMAEYLHATVMHLEELGIRDRNLWTLQELVAERIERMSGPSGATAPDRPTHQS